MTYRFTDWPHPIGMEAYEQARAELRQWAAEQPDLLALYEFGSVKAPGLSDLDLIAVLRDDPLPDAPERMEALPALGRDLMDGGTLMVMRVRDFERLPWLDDLRLGLLYGQEIPLETVPDVALPGVQICRLLDWIPERMARIEEMLSYDLIPVRKAIGLLYSFAHSVRAYHALYGLRGAEGFLEAVDGQREQPDGEALVSLLEDCQGVGWKMTRAVLRDLGQRGVYTAAVPETSSLTLRPGLSIRMGPGLPSRLYQHYAVYALAGGPIAQQIEAHLDPRPARYTYRHVIYRVHPDHLAVMDARMSVVNDMASWLARNGFKRGLYKWGWYLPALHAEVAHA
jgi:hypothetical protein